jgi:hypothetical protein
MWFSVELGNDDAKKIIDITGDNIHLVFGSPECTDLAVSGACRFASKREKNPKFQEHAMQLVHLTKDLGDTLACAWAFENPVSVISTKWRKPNFIFHPHMYGGYLPEDDIHPMYPDYIVPRDAYNKKTCIWCSDNFEQPEKLQVDFEPGDSKQYSKLGGRSKRTKNIRSATPRGFAKAVFESNKL